MHGELPATLRATRGGVRRRAGRKGETVATRKASQQAIEALRASAAGTDRRLGRSHRIGVHELVGQQADRRATRPATTSTSACANSAMCAIANGLGAARRLHSRTSARSSRSPTIARNALRMAALMKLRSIFVFTHDSIGLGEDGPTHQSVEHAASLRLIPAHGRLAARATRSRPPSRGRRRSSAQTGRRACCSRGRTCAFETRDDAQIAAIRRGGYVLADCERRGHAARGRSSPPAPKSALAMGARDALATEGIAVRVRVDARARASSTAQDAAYRAACCRAACRVSPWKRASPTAGASTSAPSTIRARRDRRHRHVRRVRARRRAVQAFRLHRRARRRRGEARCA